MPSVLYNVQGDEGDDPSHPNCFRAPLPSSATLQDFVEHFPLAGFGTFHYRFKEKADSDYGYVWKDIRGPRSTLPTYNGLIWAKVLQVQNGGTPSPRSTPRAASAPVSGKSSSSKPKIVKKRSSKKQLEEIAPRPAKTAGRTKAVRN